MAQHLTKVKKTKIIIYIILVLFILGCIQQPNTTPTNQTTETTKQITTVKQTTTILEDNPLPIETNTVVKKTLTLTSSAFEHNGNLPRKYTCEGENQSPPLSINNAPENTQELVLIMDDIDIPFEFRDQLPEGTLNHWLVINISKETTEFLEGKIPAGAIMAGEFPSYESPCPPYDLEPKEHRYQFKLYALDTQLNLNTTTTKEQTVAAMHGHILEETTLTGKYKSKNA